jgi:hypothetical protein
MFSRLQKWNRRDSRVLRVCDSSETHNPFQAGVSGVRCRPGATSVIIFREARSNERTFRQRPRDSPSACGATSIRRLPSKRGSAGTCSGERPMALAAERTADAMSWRRRSGRSARATAARTSARLGGDAAMVRDADVDDMR